MPFIYVKLESNEESDLQVSKICCCAGHMCDFGLQADRILNISIDCVLDMFPMTYSTTKGTCLQVHSCSFVC